MTVGNTSKCAFTNTIFEKLICNRLMRFGRWKLNRMSLNDN